jgi:hypothetical protein
VIDLGGHSTPVATLAQLAYRFFSRAARPDGIEHFLATGKAPTDAEQISTVVEDPESSQST